MANTPQAKKRIRRNANRAAINDARVSRIRTFIKAVESALESGKKADAAKALKDGPAGAGARSRARRDPQEYGRAQVFAAVQTGRLAGLNPGLKRHCETRLPRDRDSVSNSGPSKKPAFPAIRACRLID